MAASSVERLRRKPLSVLLRKIQNDLDSSFLRPRSLRQTTNMATNLLLTCGVCISNVHENEILNHKCIQDWYSITVNSESKTFYPTNEKGEYLAKIMWDGKEQILLLKDLPNCPSSFTERRIDNKVAEPKSLIDEYSTSDTSQQSVFNTERLDNTALEELLIEEVRKRPPIYDYTLPLSVRGRQKITDLWKEISEALNGLMSPEDAKKRWKTLKDTFSKIVAEEKKPSGSARSLKKSWKHLEPMSFLRSVSTNKISISNIMAVASNNEQNSSDNIEEQNSSEDLSFTKRRAKTNNELNDSMSRIADALCTKEVPVINLPKLPEIGALDGMFLYIKQRLQKLNSEQQDRLLLKFLQDISQEEVNERE